jgi:CRISPR-associated protein Csx17
MSTLTLSGCAPVPLAHYLKALGILRVVSEQVDVTTRGSWLNDTFSLHLAGDAAAIMKFFMHEYRPTAVLAPWNGGSGFFAKDNDDALTSIEKGATPRLDPYRVGIAAARLGLNRLGLKSKPEGETKTLLLQSCRNSFPEDALSWLDAVFVLGQDGAKFPPLLGTGGNDGRLEFTNNFMQRIVEVMDPATGEATSESARCLRAALFGSAAPALATRAPIGQFFPSAAGGANATSGFDAPSAVNPWDFILMIEGAVLFGAASVKRLENTDAGALVYPFCVRQAGVGYASAAGADEAEARCEMWMPLWSEPTGLPELRAILSEGRAHVRGRAARSGLDFAQAAVTLGVDRGIASFQRYGFQIRNGLAYFATPLERVRVRRNARVDLLADIELWHNRLRQKAGPRANPEPPASVAQTLNQLERRILDLCQEDATVGMQAVLASLGRAERALAKSFRWTNDNFISPLYGLRSGWLEKADDGSVEFRLAAALAGVHAPLGDGPLWIRQHLEPIEMGGSPERSWANWAEHPGNDVVWHDGDLTASLNAILARRLVRFQKAGVPGWPDLSPRTASFDAITAFIEGRVNEELVSDLLWGLSLVDWKTVLNQRSQAKVCEGERAGVDTEAVPSALYSLLKLCHHRMPKGEDPIPLVPAILQRASSGDGQGASELAARRLRASAKPPLVSGLPLNGNAARRTAAATIFPICWRDFGLLEKMLLKPTS